MSHGAATSSEKLTVAGAQLLVDLLGLLAFLGVTYAALQLLDVTYLARAVAMDLLSAAAIARMITAASRALLATRNPRARLVPLSDAQAADDPALDQHPLGRGDLRARLSHGSAPGRPALDRPRASCSTSSSWS